MYYSSNICSDSCHAEHPSSFQPDLLSGISAPLPKDGEKIKMLNKQVYYSNSGTCSRMTCFSQQELNPAMDSGHTSTKRHPSVASTSCGHPEWNFNSGHQAKRARVESIIKGMTGSPGMHCSEVMKNQYEESDSMEGNEQIEEVHLHQGTSPSSSTSHSQMTRQELQSQLRTGFDNVDAPTCSSGASKEEKYHTWKDYLESSASEKYTDVFESSSSRKLQGWKKVKLTNYFHSKPERLKLMTDVLKYELSRAVSRSVDSIFESTPLLQPLSVSEGNIRVDLPLQSTICKDSKPRRLCGGNTEVSITDVQTEALSLVVQKPQHELDKKLNLQSRSRASQSPKPQVLLDQELILCEDKLSEESHHTACLQEGVPVKCPTFNAPWNSTKVRSKVNSRSARRAYIHTESLDPLLLESWCHPRVKIESDRLVKNNLYVLNEGLTTSHLKKAKLMFFFTRYPSSMVLKMCFHDVQFTRCITSQLIKWFSNFREFFYIQMEKFARHALMEGLTDIRSLTVGRESELFRSLNMHYNKANDFQVPDRFLEVAEITLREFFIAISLGKDHDPSWKKVIYKVICKLDSDVPAEFKQHSSG
ncbi:prospero homeobox protein 2-like [Halichoeres trimaculatus]|uniref:prospero homeobox protein 2-like n=1 Tax=Halichoeres trimaculatus TaxID=147232 RepID=UPI003D9F8725